MDVHWVKITRVIKDHDVVNITNKKIYETGDGFSKANIYPSVIIKVVNLLVLM